MTAGQSIQDLCLRLAAGFACMAGGVAGLALLSQIAGSASLAALGQGLAPMPILSAALSALLSLALLAAMHGHAGLRRLGVLLALLAAILCLWLVAGGLLGGATLLERLASRGGLLTRMSIPAALAGLGAALSILARGLPAAPSLKSRRAAAILAVVPLGIGAVALTSYAAGAPLLYESSSVPMSLPSSLCALGIGLATVLAARCDGWPGAVSGFGSRQEKPESLRWLLTGPLAIFLLTGVLVLAGGSFSLRGQLRSERTRARDELAAIADLKAKVVGDWYAERRLDAEQLFQGTLVQTGLRRFLAGSPLAPFPADLRTWLEGLRGSTYSRVVLFDGKGRPRFTAPAREGPTLQDIEASGVEAALHARTVILEDLRGGAGGAGAHMDLWIPVRIHPEGEGPAEGVFLLRIDPRRFLYPFLHAWPTPSLSAETMLVRRDGDEALILNDLRHRSQAALDLRIPLDPGPQVPAVLAARGQEGLVAEADYRGIPVLAVLRRVPGTPWTLVAKVDEAEVYGPLRERVWTGGLGLVGLVALAAVALGSVVARREARMGREQAALSQRFEGLMRQASDIILLADAEGRILEANAQAMEQYGYSLAELQAMSLQDLHPPAAGQEAEGQMEQLKARGAILFETLHARKDGTAFPVEVSAKLVHLDGVPGVIGFVRDITDRRAQHLELQRVAQLYAALSQVNQAIVWTKNRQELFARICEVMVEPGGFRMAWIGWNDSASGQVSVAARHGEDSGFLDAIRIRPGDPLEGSGPVATAIRENCPCIINDLLAGAEPAPWREAATGAGFASTAAFPIHRGGAVQGALCVYAREKDFFGVREASLLEEAARNVSFAIDHHDQEEERQALEAQLQQSQKLESLGSLAGGVAHDMNNVMGAILGIASTHREQLDPADPLARSLDTIISACLRGRGVVKSLLYFARKDLEETQPVDLNAMVRDMVQLLAYTTLKRAEFSMDLQDGLGLIQGDAGALGHALMNLCVNAMDAMPEGGTITIRTRRLPDGGIMLTVRDTGQGMAPEVLARATEPFYTTKPVGKGTGLGLAMVFGTMKAHGGSLDLRSQPGDGTEAILVFPAPPEPAVQAGQGAKVEAQAIPASALRILLVDDDELIRESMSLLLRSVGHQVHVAGGGAEAIERVRSGLVVDLVILDMNMPGLTGAETLPRLLALRPGQPILLASGYSEEYLEPILAAHPTVRSLPKPFTLRELQRKLAGFAFQAPGRESRPED